MCLKKINPNSYVHSKTKKESIKYLERKGNILPIKNPKVLTFDLWSLPCKKAACILRPSLGVCEAAAALASASLSVLNDLL